VREEVDIGPLPLLFVAVPGIIGIIAGLAWTSRRLSLAHSDWMLRLSSMSLLTGLFLLAFVDHGFTLAMQSTSIPAVQDFEAWMNTTAAIVVPASFMGGFGLCVVVMSARFVLTELAPQGAQGRVHAVQLVITEAILVIPVLLAGVAASFAGTRLMLAIVGILALGTLLATEWRRAGGSLAGVRPVLSPEPVPVKGALANAE
jgi:hypothetical protein